MVVTHFEASRHTVPPPLLRVRRQLDREPVRAARRGDRGGTAPGAQQRQPRARHAAPAHRARAPRPEVPADVHPVHAPAALPPDARRLRGLRGGRAGRQGGLPHHARRHAAVQGVAAVDQEVKVMQEGAVDADQRRPPAGQLQMTKVGRRRRRAGRRRPLAGRPAARGRRRGPAAAAAAAAAAPLPGAPVRLPGPGRARLPDGGGAGRGARRRRVPGGRRVGRRRLRVGAAGGRLPARQLMRIGRYPKQYRVRVLGDLMLVQIGARASGAVIRVGWFLASFPVEYIDCELFASFFFRVDSRFCNFWEDVMRQRKGS